MKENETKQEQKTIEKNNSTCGIIMPISSIDGCSMEHWTEVNKIISEAICDAGYKPNLVSNADDIGIIQKRIIQNIYYNDIVVCDVSGKNPNVMFELGMRLAFDKPAIIVIDDKTDYSFDTSPIEHLSYPRDLRYYDIINFKEQLKNKIIATVEKANNDKTYTTYLKNFGEFEVAHVEKKEGSINDVILSRLDDLSRQISSSQKQITLNRDIIYQENNGDQNIIAKNILKEEIEIYCKSNNITNYDLFINKNGEKDKLLFQLERKAETRDLCVTHLSLRRLVDSIIDPFK